MRLLSCFNITNNTAINDAGEREPLIKKSQNQSNLNYAIWGFSSLFAILSTPSVIGLTLQAQGILQDEDFFADFFSNEAANIALAIMNGVVVAFFNVFNGYAALKDFQKSIKESFLKTITWYLVYTIVAFPLSYNNGMLSGDAVLSWFGNERLAFAAKLLAMPGTLFALWNFAVNASDCPLTRTVNFFKYYYDMLCSIITGKNSNPIFLVERLNKRICSQEMQEAFKFDENNKGGRSLKLQDVSRDAPEENSSLRKLEVMVNHCGPELSEGFDGNKFKNISPLTRMSALLDLTLITGSMAFAFFASYYMLGVGMDIAYHFLEDLGQNPVDDDKESLQIIIENIFKYGCFSIQLLGNIKIVPVMIHFYKEMIIKLFNLFFNTVGEVFSCGKNILKDMVNFFAVSLLSTLFFGLSANGALADFCLAYLDNDSVISAVVITGALMTFVQRGVGLNSLIDKCKNNCPGLFHYKTAEIDECTSDLIHKISRGHITAEEAINKFNF